MLYSDSSHPDMVAENAPIAQLIDGVFTSRLNCVKEIHTGLCCLSKSGILQNTQNLAFYKTPKSKVP